MKTALLTLFSILLFSNAAIAGKFKPVKSDDWPETAEAPASDGSDGDEGGGRSPASAGASGGASGGQLPAIKMLPDGSIDPQSLKDYTP